MPVRSWTVATMLATAKSILASRAADAVLTVAERTGVSNATAACDRTIAALRANGTVLAAQRQTRATDLRTNGNVLVPIDTRLRVAPAYIYNAADLMDAAATLVAGGTVSDLLDTGD